MHYPWWYVPFLTSPMLIAAMATIHIFVAMYAVGGGLFLAVEAQYAHRTQNRPYLAYLQDHAWFFILLTVVFGAITGVGIWWTIGLASPLATEALIHIFIFGWAMEYVFFVVEPVTAFPGPVHRRDRRDRVDGGAGCEVRSSAGGLLARPDRPCQESISAALAGGAHRSVSSQARAGPVRLRTPASGCPEHHASAASRPAPPAERRCRSS